MAQDGEEETACCRTKRGRASILDKQGSYDWGVMMAEVHVDDQVAPAQQDGVSVAEMLGLLWEARKWREHRNHQEARTDAVLLQRFVDMGDAAWDVTVEQKV